MGVVPLCKNKMTDLTHWKLQSTEGRQVWEYKQTACEHSFAEKYFIGLDGREDTIDLESLPNSTTEESVYKAVKFYSRLQLDDGHWGNDYGGPMFLLPGLIITCYITQVELQHEKKVEMIRYLTNTQREDGGWGLHIESPSTMFGSALTYVTLRILGMESDHPVLTKARDWIRTNGGAQGIPSWGKFWLAALGVYEWEGLNPIPPEFWLFPYALPLHPGRWWCHCRMVYLPMGYIYGRKLSPPLNPFLSSLRKELYEVTPYEKIAWSSMGNNVCPLDLYTPHSFIVNTVHATLKMYERWHSSWLRQKALNEVMEQIHAEDQNTKHICIGPVNKAMNMLCCFYHDGPDSDAFRDHIPRIDDYLWLGRDGMKMQGYNGSQLWDSAFSIQAIISAGLSSEFKDVLQKGYEFLDVAQVREEVPTPDRHYRHISVGAWPFSTRDHGWPISDCTAEGLKAVLALHSLPPEVFQPTNRISDERLYEAVNVILSLQNTDGSWSTYENKRTTGYVEQLNPSETFHGIMIDYPYVECSSACVQALSSFQKSYPDHRTNEIQTSISRGLKLIHSLQEKDGSWRGSWGVCFTYATWFGIFGCVAGGETIETSRVISSACDFLLSTQNEDGGWGESFQSCVQMKYVSHPDGSQVVNTAWAVMSLISAKHPNKKAIQRGIEFLSSKQMANGDWEQEGISGVFNANCAISYSGYKNIFPIWAMGDYLRNSQ